MPLPPMRDPRRAAHAMRLAWIGFHEEGLPALTALLEAGAPVVAVFTLAPEAGTRRSGYADYAPVCRAFGVRLEYIDHVNDARTRALLESLDPDLVFVIGWTQLVETSVLRIPRLGMIGAHASLLPADRGRAPINWALIHGRRVTGNSLIWLAPEADTGDLIDQVEIPITPYDTCATLYARVAEANRDMILRALPALLEGRRPGRPQGRSAGAPLPARRPSDGAIDWSASSESVYDFVRALTRPYPGAFGWLGDTQYRVWRCALLPLSTTTAAPPGTVLGSAISPTPEACGQVVACGSGSLVLLEIEDEHGATLSGPLLSEQQWRGRVWRPCAEARAGGRRTSR